jgi:hypothetical protein
MNRFLNNAIQSQTRARVNLQLRILATKEASDVEKVLGFRNQVLQGGEQPDFLNFDGVKPVRKAARLADGVADKAG